MLVLTRKLGEVIRIGKDIKVILVDIDHNKARIGVEAPRSVLIMREELLDDKKIAEMYRDEPLEGHGG